MKPVTLEQWLARLERLHPREIDMDLRRVAGVARAMGLAPGLARVLTVGGTNGKGTCVAYIEAVMRSAGHRVGAYTSPHLLRYNERVRIDGREADDAALLEAFAAVEAARAGTSLTYFEFGTLAAAKLFVEAGCDAWVLEVGLGGRLDAVNIFDADVSVITSIGLDHQDWLGPDLDSIGREKAGIFRPGRPAVFAGLELPGSVQAVAGALGARLHRLGREFGYRLQGTSWDWWTGQNVLQGLPMPRMSGAAVLRDVSAALMAVRAAGLNTGRDDIVRGLGEVALPGRFQICPGSPDWVLDVGHNPQAAAELATNLADRPCAGRTLMIFGMLADKDAAGVSAVLTGQVDHWFAVGVDGSRRLDANTLAGRIVARPGVTVQACESIAAACSAARALAQPRDRIVACGSFRLVGPILERLYSSRGGTDGRNG